jgi:hypothetical protein
MNKPEPFIDPLTEEAKKDINKFYLGRGWEQSEDLFLEYTKRYAKSDHCCSIKIGFSSLGVTISMENIDDMGNDDEIGMWYKDIPDKSSAEKMHDHFTQQIRQYMDDLIEYRSGKLAEAKCGLLDAAADTAKPKQKRKSKPVPPPPPPKKPRKPRASRSNSSYQEPEPRRPGKSIDNHMADIGFARRGTGFAGY